MSRIIRPSHLSRIRACNNALIWSGLTIERVEEFPTESDWRFGDAVEEARMLPGELLVVARRGVS